MAFLGIDADRGRGAYDLLSLAIVFDGFDGGLGLVAGTSSATNTTELSVIFSARLPFDNAGEMGSLQAPSTCLVASSPGAVEVDV